MLVDGAVLLDLSPALAPDGVSLADVRTVLVTHAHPDHCAPAALLWRHWVLPDEQLTIAGPADVLEQCRPWLAPGAAVEALAGADLASSCSRRPSATGSTTAPATST